MKLSGKVLSVVLVMTIIVSITVISVTDSYAEGRNDSTGVTINYTGNYYDVLGGLEDLATRDDTSTVISDLRALINYTSSQTVVSNGNTVKGTDAKHPSYTGTGSNSLAALYKKSERKANDTRDGIRMFYTNDYITNSSWNREHVWPQSKSGGLYGKTGGGNDLHHIRPTYDKDNSKHGSYPYGYVTDGTPYYCNGNDSSYIIAYTAPDHTMEVVDSYKGDIARIFAYMVTHYETLYDRIDTVLTGGYKTLVEWNAIDPVDEYELNRNEVAYSYQGNRNPFIDCPDLINVIWSDAHYDHIDSDTESDVIYSDDDDTTDVTSNYLTLKQANELNVGDSAVLRGQVTYIYGGCTVILEETDEYGNINTFQIYDQAGVINGKYPFDAVVEVEGVISEYYGVLQIKMPSKVKTISSYNAPIPAVECTIDELEDNMTKLIVLKNVTLSEYNSSEITLTDEYGNEVDCFKPAEYPYGIEAGDVVDVCCVAYEYKGDIQIRIANSDDYCEEYIWDTTDNDILDVTDSEYDSDDHYAEDSEDEYDSENKGYVIDSDPQDKPLHATLLGDTDCNGVLDMVDVVTTQKYIAKLIDNLKELGMINADMNGNGRITLEDVVEMQRVIAKLD